MAILIKGMAMPTSCVDCPMMQDENGYCKLRKEYVYGDIPRSCPLAKLITIEELMEPMCDQCQWPGWYKDPDDMMREKCSDCPVEAKLAEALYDDA